LRAVAVAVAVAVVLCGCAVLGADTAGVLRELGVDDAVLAELLVTPSSHGYRHRHRHARTHTV